MAFEGLSCHILKQTLMSAPIAKAEQLLHAKLETIESYFSNLAGHRHICMDRLLCLHPLHWRPPIIPDDYRICIPGSWLPTASMSTRHPGKGRAPKLGIINSLTTETLEGLSAEVAALAKAWSRKPPKPANARDAANPRPSPIFTDLHRMLTLLLSKTAVSQLGAWGTGVGGLPTFCPAGLERVRDRLPVRRRHRRAVAAWRQTRTGFPAWGFTLEGRVLHLMADRSGRSLVRSPAQRLPFTSKFLHPAGRSAPRTLPSHRLLL
jgi:hypothetical protein